MVKYLDKYLLKSNHFYIKPSVSHNRVATFKQIKHITLPCQLLDTNVSVDAQISLQYYEFTVLITSFACGELKKRKDGLLF